MQKAIIDLSKNGIIPVFHAKQGDTSRRVAITLLDNGLPYDTAADAVSVWYRGPSGEGNYSDGIDKDGSTLTILVNPNMTSASGRHTCAVMLSNESGRCTTWNFCVEVAYTPALGSEEAKAYFEAFEAGKLAADIAAVDARTAKAVAELNARVSAIIASGTATEGNTELIDIRTGSDGKVYQTAGDAVREQVGGIKSDLDALSDELGSIFNSAELEVNPKFTNNTQWVVNGNIAEKISGSGNYHQASDEIDVTGVKKVTYSCKTYEKVFPVIIVDENYTVLRTVDQVNTLKDISGTVDVPSNAKYIIFNTWYGTAQLSYKQVYYDKFDNKLNKNLGESEKGKILVVGNDGNIIAEKLESNDTQEIPYLNMYMHKEEDITLGASFDSDGSVKNSGGTMYAVTGFIKIKFDEFDFHNIRSDGTLSVSSSVVYDVAYFDTDKNFISFATNKSGLFVNGQTMSTIPKNAKYIRLKIRYDNTPIIYEKLMISPYWAREYIRKLDRYIPYDGKKSEYYPNIIQTDSFKGKTLAVIGDSIGTWASHNASEIVVSNEDVGIQLSAFVTNNDIGTTIGGNTISSSDVGTEITFIPTSEDIGKEVGKALTHGNTEIRPWWYYLCNELRMTCNNVSWSGSSYTSHEGDSNIYSCSYAWHDSQIRKCGTRINGSMDRIAPDIIVLARGVNDFSHSNLVRLTGASNSRFIPSEIDTDIVDGGYGFEEALNLTINKLRIAYPKAKIYICTITSFRRNSESGFPPINSNYSLPQFNNAIRNVAEYNSCGIINMDKVLTWGRMEELTADNTHPNNYGHHEMFRQAMKDILFN